MEAEWWGEVGCRMAWRTHAEAEAAGPGSFHSAPLRNPKFKEASGRWVS